MLLALLAVGADRGAAWATGESLSTAVERSGSDVADAEVTIHGFPYLTQLVDGSLDRVTASLGRGSFAGYQVSDVRVDARDVQPRSPWTTGHATAEGVVAFDTVAALLSEQLGTDVTVGPAPDDPGSLTLGVPVAVFGETVEVGVVLLPGVVDGAITVQVRAVSLAGAAVSVDDVPGGLADQLTGLRIPLDLPAGVTLTGVRGEQDGLRLMLEARDVALADLAW